MAKLPQYVNVPWDKKDDPLFDPRFAHSSIENFFLNGTKVPLYVRDLTGRIIYVPTRPNCHPNGNVIFISTTYRAYVNCQKDSITKERYRITPSMVSKGRAVYVRELGLYVSSDKDYLATVSMAVLPGEVSQSELISGTLKRFGQCPIKVIINDPSEKIRNVYMVIENRVYQIEVGGNPKFGGTCIVQFASTSSDEAESIVDFDIEELRSAFTETGSMVPQIGDYQFIIFPSFVAAETHVNDTLKELDKQAIGLATREKESLKRTYEEKIKTLEYENTRKDQVIKESETEIRGLRKQFELIGEREKREAQAVTLENTAALQQLALKKEQARVAKSRNDLQSSDISTTATVVKSAAVVAPLLIGALGMYMSKSSQDVLGRGISVPLIAGATLAARSGISWFKDTFLS